MEIEHYYKDDQQSLQKIKDKLENLKQCYEKTI